MIRQRVEAEIIFRCDDLPERRGGGADRTTRGRSRLRVDRWCGGGLRAQKTTGGCPCFYSRAPPALGLRINWSPELGHPPEPKAAPQSVGMSVEF